MNHPLKLMCTSQNTGQGQSDKEKGEAAIEQAQRSGILYQTRLSAGSFCNFDLDCFPYLSTYEQDTANVAAGFLQTLRHVRSKQRLVWDSIMILAAVTLLVLEMSDSADTWCLVTDDQDGFAGAIIVFTVFGLDILLSVSSIGVLDGHRHLIDPQPAIQNARQYLFSGWFALDVVALFPWCWLQRDDLTSIRQDQTNEADTVNFAGLRVVRILRFARFMRFARLLRTSQHVSRVHENLQYRKKLGGQFVGGDDGISQLTGPEYKKYRLEPLIERYRNSVAQRDVIVHICQHGAAALAMTGSVLGALGWGRWVVVTAWLASAAIATMTFFKINTIQSAMAQAHKDCENLSFEFSQYDVADKNDPSNVHDLVMGTEEAVAREHAAWALAVSKGEREKNQEINSARSGGNATPSNDLEAQLVDTKLRTPRQP